MLDIKLIRENPEMVKKGVTRKGIDSKLVDSVLDLDEKKRALQARLDEIRAEKNKLGKEIAQLTEEEKDSRIAALRAQDVKFDSLEEEYRVVEDKFRQNISKLPNLPDEDVPEGKSEEDNIVTRTVGEPTRFDFEPADYMTLAHEMDLIDTQRSAKISGTRFGYIKGAAAWLQFALGQHVLRSLTDAVTVKKIATAIDPALPAHPFVPIVPPVMIKEEPYWKMARLDHEIYHIPKDDLYLVGSAEHSIGPMHMDEVFSESELPRRYIGYSTAFRRESGSYGRDTKGILRVHQFDKWEMESFAHPQQARKEFDFMAGCMEYLLGSLELPYQVVFKCAGDVGFPNARGIDLNVWLPGEQNWRETHTADYMSDYQARRLNTRVRRPDGGMEFAHMIDATAFAIGRTLIAIIENYQQEDGSIAVPEVLKPYLPFEIIRGPFGMGKI